MTSPVAAGLSRGLEYLCKCRPRCNGANDKADLCGGSFSGQEGIVIASGRALPSDWVRPLECSIYLLQQQSLRVQAGAMAQNVYLYCAGAGLAAVVRAWFDALALSQAMGLSAGQQVVLTQTLDEPKTVATD